MGSESDAARRLHLADAVFAAGLVVYALASASLIPYDFTDLCYLFSLERGTWVTQEWVHPIYVPTLRVLAGLLAAFGYHGRMLVPVEIMNVVVASVAYVLLYRLARRVSGPSLAAVVALVVAATSTGFWNATLRSTPYALALLCQVLCLSALVAEDPVPPRRYGLAGAYAGLAMGYHASAMALAVSGLVSALFEPDPDRSRRTTFARIAAFAGAMLGVAIVCWGVFLAYNGLGPEYFRRQDFQDTFQGIEQVPNTSIYTSGSIVRQLSSFAATVSFQADVLVNIAGVALVVALAGWFWTGRSLGSAGRRLALATAGNFAGIAAFFIINNTHNGFIFAAFTLVPAMIAGAVGRSPIALALLVCVGLPGTVLNVRRTMGGGPAAASDPQLTEARFLQRTLGNRDVLLTPGSPFPEVLYLAHLNVFEVSTGDATHPASEVPVLRPGDALRARVAWWIGHGGRVLYALGDDSVDFTGDVGGAEKERQIFWRNETEARERGPALQALRAAMEASGLQMRDTLTSPRGNRYAEIALGHSPGPNPARSPVAGPETMPELRRMLMASAQTIDDPQLPGRARFLAEVGAAIPDDPWLVCDWMALACQYDGSHEPCRPLAGCDARIEEHIATASTRGQTHGRRVGRHLTPAITEILRDSAPGALGPIVRAGFVVTAVEVRGDAISVSIRDGDKRYAVTLALPEAKADGTPDGRGRNFVFYLTPAGDGSNPAASGMLLAAATRFDEAIPDSALGSD